MVAILPNVYLDVSEGTIFGDDTLRTALGPRLLDGYVKTERQEWHAFSRAVTDWEQPTYTAFF